MLRLQPIILLVDDTPDNLRVLSKMLDSQDYKIRKTISGEMALKAAQIEPPDLILLDINMPKMSGYEVCEQLKTHDKTCHIPIIFISALDQVADKNKAFQLGGVDYITKPFQEQEILVKVRNQLTILQQKQQLQQFSSLVDTVHALGSQLQTECRDSLPELGKSYLDQIQMNTQKMQVIINSAI